MDEPLSNLDAKLREQMRTEILKLYQKLQTTFVYVTHDQTEAMTLGTRIVVMCDGIIQQVDTPQNLYNRPVNIFVASFIGTPQMNFLDMRVIERNNKIYLEYDEYAYPLDNKHSILLAERGYVGKDVIIGIRPKNIVINNSIQNEHTSICADIELIEQLGSETYLHLRAFDKAIIACVEPEIKLKLSDIVEIEFDFARACIFNKETKEAIYE